MLSFEELTKNRKVVYYPELGYYNPDFWRLYLISLSEIVTRLSNHHVKNLKLLSFYFHYILLPIGHLLTSPNKIHRQVIRRLFQLNEIKELIERRIIITTTWYGMDMKVFLETMEDFLINIKWYKNKDFNNIKKDIKDDLVKIFHFSRDVKSQSLFLKKRFEDILHSYEEFSDIKILKELIKYCEFEKSTLVIPFVHEKFIKEIIKKYWSENRNEYIEIIKGLNTVYFESGEFGNKGSIIYTSKDLESIFNTRKSMSTGILCFLYSPNFFKNF